MPTKRKTPEERKLRLLSPEELQQIAWRLDEPAAAVARELGLDYWAVAYHHRRMRRAGGWVCELHWTTCAVCGRPLCYGERPRKVHVHCERRRVVERSRERRERNPGQSTPYVRRYREEHPEKLVEHRRKGLDYARARFEALPPELKAASLAKAHEADRRDQPLTAELAEASGSPWTADEDQYVLDHLLEPARDVALALGRTLWAVRNRRAHLRRALGLPVKRSKYL